MNYAPEILFGVCLFLLLLAAVEHYTRRSGLPPLCWILLAGLIYGTTVRYTTLPLPSLHLSPPVVLFGFLPLLIFDSSRQLQPRRLLAILPEAGLFAVAGPLLSMAVIGLLLAALGGIPIADALLFGAALAATDAVAVTAIFHALPIPEKLQTILEGESLLNDGTTVILFSALAGRVIAETVFSVPHTAGRFLLSVGGAVLLGVAMGGLRVLLAKLWHELHDRFIGALIPLITVYAAFGLAEHVFHVSGVIAVMSATLTITAFHKRHDADHPADIDADQFFEAFWGFLAKLFNAVLFFILGAQIGEHIYDLRWTLIPIMIAALLVSRCVTVYPGAALLRLTHRPMDRLWKHVLNIGGLRGALSVALLLSLPETYVHRHVFLCIAFVLIFFTLTVNPLLLRSYLKRRPSN